MSYKVYLAGPITGLTYKDSQTWRDYVSFCLSPEIRCYSPLRAKSFLDAYGVLNNAKDYASASPLSSAKGIVTRDHWDCYTSDLIFCNLLGANVVSIGTVMEIAWAHAYRKPLVLAMEPDNIHSHPMLEEVSGYIVNDLDEAIGITRAILLEKETRS